MQMTRPMRTCQAPMSYRVADGSRLRDAMVAQIGEGPMRKALGRHEEHISQWDRSPLRRKCHRHT